MDSFHNLIGPLIDNSMFSIKYLAMHKVQMHTSAINTLFFATTNDVSIKLLNVIKSSQLHNACIVLVKKNVDVMIRPCCNAFHLLSDKQIRAHFNYCQIKTYVQTARESHDLNMGLYSFDNGFKNLRNNFMQDFKL